MIKRIIAAAAFTAAAFAPAAASAAIPFGSGTVPAAITAVTVYGDQGIVLTATLTGPGGPLPGETVSFTGAGSSVGLCSAVAGADGVAQCPVTQRQVTLIRGDQGIWWARFGGDGTYAAAARAGHL